MTELCYHGFSETPGSTDSCEVCKTIAELRKDRTSVLELLRAIREQGILHQCALEGHIDRYGCEDCNTNTEAKIEAMIRKLEQEGK